MSSGNHAESILTTVKEYICGELTYADEADFGGATDLIEQGVIDSMSLLRLISFLETRFAIQVPDEEIVPQNFRCLNDIHTLIVRNQSSPKS